MPAQAAFRSHPTDARKGATSVIPAAPRGHRLRGACNASRPTDHPAAEDDVSGPSNDPALPALPPRPSDGHKGTFGTVVVIGGSATMVGAPALSATGALRAGCGLCRIAAPSAILAHCLTLEPSATGIALADDPAALAGALDASWVVAAGPGLGEGPGIGALVDALLAAPQRLVLDADALNALARRAPPAARAADLTLTPHPGEFRRLARAWGIDADPVAPHARADAAAALARLAHATVLLKGAGTVVSDGARTRVLRHADPVLAVPGSGDVLTGLIAGLMAQGMTAFDAAVLAAHLHAEAGRRWRERHGTAGMLARELAALLPEAMAAHPRAGAGDRR